MSALTREVLANEVGNAVAEAAGWLEESLSDRTRELVREEFGRFREQMLLDIRELVAAALGVHSSPERKPPVDSYASEPESAAANTCAGGSCADSCAGDCSPGANAAARPLEEPSAQPQPPLPEPAALRRRSGRSVSTGSPPDPVEQRPPPAAPLAPDGAPMAHSPSNAPTPHPSQPRGRSPDRAARSGDREHARRLPPPPQQRDLCGTPALRFDGSPRLQPPVQHCNYPTRMPECEAGHRLQRMVSGVEDGCTGFATHRCDRCAARGLRDEVWRCQECDYDLCPECAADIAMGRADVRRFLGRGPSVTTATTSGTEADDADAEWYAQCSEVRLDPDRAGAWAVLTQQRSLSGMSAAESAAAAATAAAAAYDSATPTVSARRARATTQLQEVFDEL